MQEGKDSCRNYNGRMKYGLAGYKTGTQMDVWQILWEGQGLAAVGSSAQASAMAALILASTSAPNPLHPPSSALRSPSAGGSSHFLRVVRREVLDWGRVNTGNRKDRGSEVVRASKDKDEKRPSMSVGDRLLDYIEGGPKLRKWYGATDQLPRDGNGGDDKAEQSEDEEEDEERGGVRDAVLVTDADSDTGQLLVLALILKRLRVRALVRDAKAAIAAFGPYVEPVEGDVSDIASLRKALQGVRAVICPSKVGLLAESTVVEGLDHIVFLSQLAVYRNEGGIAALFNGSARNQAEQDEAAIASSGVPYTIVRPGTLRDEPGGKLGFDFVQDGAASGSISREDAATICVHALDAPPLKAHVFEVINGKEKIEDWKAVFSNLKDGTVVL